MKARGCAAGVAAALSVVCAFGSSATEADDACPFTTDEAIVAVIQTNLQTIEGKRLAAESCSAQTPRPSPISIPGAPAPTTLQTLKDSYNAWLTEVAYTIRTYAPPPVQVFQPPSVSPPPPPSDLPSEYLALARDAGAIDQYLSSCLGGGPKPPDCGTDVNCQRGEAEASGFFQVGQSLVTRFKSCSVAIRKKAYDELMSHHSWN